MNHRAIIQRSLEYIEENLQAEITAAELADAAGFSLFSPAAIRILLAMWWDFW